MVPDGVFISRHRLQVSANRTKQPATLQIETEKGQVETDETENGNGRLKRKPETEKLKFGNGTFCACANCVMLGSFSASIGN